MTPWDLIRAIREGLEHTLIVDSDTRHDVIEGLRLAERMNGADGLGEKRENDAIREQALHDAIVAVQANRLAKDEIQKNANNNAEARAGGCRKSHSATRFLDTPLACPGFLGHASGVSWFQAFAIFHFKKPAFNNLVKPATDFSGTRLEQG